MPMLTDCTKLSSSCQLCTSIAHYTANVFPPCILSSHDHSFIHIHTHNTLQYKTMHYNRIIGPPIGVFYIAWVSVAQRLWMVHSQH
jgi:hypothetical protein